MTPQPNSEPLPASGLFCGGCCLREGPHDGTIIEIEPTMKNLRHKGEAYFRVPRASRIQDGQRFAIYLWAGWKPQNAPLQP